MGRITQLGFPWRGGGRGRGSGRVAGGVRRTLPFLNTSHKISVWKKKYRSSSSVTLFHYHFPEILQTMSLIVEQTLPYNSSQLQLEDPKRWSRLFPLMRPSIKTIEVDNGQVIVVDTALANSKNVLIAAVGSVGNFSSKILSESHLAAFTIEQNGRPTISADKIAKVLKDASFPVENGVVVVRAASTQDLRRREGVAELSVSGELKLDHVLSLLSAANPEIK